MLTELPGLSPNVNLTGAGEVPLFLLILSNVQKYT
jgi:hypothetical protein